MERLQKVIQDQRAQLDQKEGQLDQLTERIEKAKDDIRLEQQKQAELESAAVADRTTKLQQLEIHATQKHENELQELERRLKSEQKAKLTDILEKIQKK